MGRPRTISREEVLQAAAAVAAQDGPGAITLESVAARAGISKGGLQYLFRSKQALMGAMIEHYTAQLDAAVRQAHDELPDTPGRPLKAYVLGSLRGALQRDPVTAALLAAAVTEPELLAPGRAAFRRSLDEMAAQGVDRQLAMIVISAVDGLLFSEFLQVAPYTAAERKRLVERLLVLAETGQVPIAAAAPKRGSRKAGA